MARALTSRFRRSGPLLPTVGVRGFRLLAKPKRAGVVLADYSTQWLRERDLKPRTRVLYGRQLALYLLPTFGKRSLASITPASVREWHADFDSDSPTSRAHAYALLKAILTSAMQDDLIDANRAVSVVRPLRRAGAP